MGLSYDAQTQVYQCFHPEGGGVGLSQGIGQFWKILGQISHLHVPGTFLCQFENPLGPMPLSLKKKKKKKNWFIHLFFNQTFRLLD